MSKNIILYAPGVGMYLTLSCAALIASTFIICLNTWTRIFCYKAIQEVAFSLWRNGRVVMHEIANLNTLVRF